MMLAAYFATVTCGLVLLVFAACHYAFEPDDLDEKERRFREELERRWHKPKDDDDAE